MGVDEVDHRAEAQPVDDVAERAADDGAECRRHQRRFRRGGARRRGRRPRRGRRRRAEGSSTGRSRSAAEGDAVVPDHGEVQDREQRRSGRCPGRRTTSRIHHLLAWSAARTTTAAARPSRVRWLRVMRRPPPPDPLPQGESQPRLHRLRAEGRQSVRMARLTVPPPVSTRASSRMLLLPTSAARASIARTSAGAGLIVADALPCRARSAHPIRSRSPPTDPRPTAVFVSPRSAAASPPPAAMIRACWPAVPPRSER